MIDRLLMAISGRLPCRIISEDGTPYLERYYLFTLLGWRFYLHRFVGSDPDRGVHDHPWRRAFSIILSGWYFEETRTGTRKVRWFNSLTGDTFHRVILPNRMVPCDIDRRDPDQRQGRETYKWVRSGPPAPVWTLFFHTVGDVKPWGFLRPMMYDNGRPVAFSWKPYTYKGGKNTEWWKTARKGQEVRE